MTTPLGKILSAMALLLLPFTTAFGQILYTDVNPDSTLSATAVAQEKGYFIDLDHDGVYEFEIRHFNPNLDWMAVEIQRNFSVTQQVLTLPPDGHSKVLSKGDTVSAKSTKWGLDCCGILDAPWYTGEDVYFGFRFKKSNKWHYGWARISIPVDASNVTIKDFACNQTADSPIVVGQTATSSVYEQQEAHNTLEIFPNPLSSTATIRLHTTAINARLVISNMLGEKVKEVAGVSGNEVLIDRSGLASGTYIVQLIQDNAIISTKRIIIQD